MSITITTEICAAHSAYLNEPVDAFVDGTPIRRRDTYPYQGDSSAGLVDFAAGWQEGAKRVEELTAENATLKKHDAELTEWNKKLHAQNEEFRTLLVKSADQLAVWSKLAGALEGKPR